RRVADRSDLVDRDDARVVQRGQRARLRAKLLEPRGIRLRLGREHLERDAAGELLLHGLVYDAHAAAVDDALDAVARGYELPGGELVRLVHVISDSVDPGANGRPASSTPDRRVAERIAKRRARARQTRASGAETDASGR